MDAQSGGIRRLIGRRRFRLQAAGLAALALILLLVLILPARRVRITVDGAVTTVVSRASSDVAVVEQAGVELEPGDRVEAMSDDALVVHRATEAILEVDGKTFALRTQAKTIDELLLEANIPLRAQDSVLRNQTFVSPSASVAPPAPLAAVLARSTGRIDTQASDRPVALEVRRAVPFSVIENGQVLQLRSSRETVATALRAVGVRLGPGDDIQPSLDTELTAGLQVHVEHAIEVVVTLPEAKTIVYTLAATVGDALEESGIDLPPDYRLEPAAETAIAPGLAIHVIAISEEQVMETERIESRTIYEPDPSLPWSEHRVVPGQDGVHYRQYNIVYENGEVVSRELAAEWYDPEPADTVIYYSTADAPPPPPGAIPDELNVVSVIRVYATWYNPASSGRPSSDPSYGLTATGVPVTVGVVAVDPGVIPLGTQMYIPGYGFAVAADTGGGVRGDMIDLGYPDGVVADWTSQWVDIYILGP